jgi:hypothetical protein
LKKPVDEPGGLVDKPVSQGGVRPKVKPEEEIPDLAPEDRFQQGDRLLPPFLYFLQVGIGIAFLIVGAEIVDEQDVPEAIQF